MHKKTQKSTDKALQRFQLEIWFCENFDLKADTSLHSRAQRSIGSDSQGRVTAANNQRQLSSEPRKPFNTFLPLHINTNKSRESSVSASPATTTGGKEAKKQSPGKDLFAPVPVVPVAPVTPVMPAKEPHGAERTSGGPLVDRTGELGVDSSQVSVRG